MSLTLQELHNIAQLAYLHPNEEQLEPLAEEIRAILHFAEQLNEINTDETAPLFYSLELSQRLRADDVTEGNCQQALATLAPEFENSFYLVPQIMEG